MMDVAILSVHDWANLGYTLSKCLKEVGINATSLIEYKLPNYDDTSQVSSIKGMKKLASESDVVIFMHSKHIRLDIDLSGKKVFVFHGGSKYRHNYEELNKVFNPIVEKCIIQTYDLFNLGAKNETWLLPPVDTNLIKPVYGKKYEKIVIGHFPSGGIEKGTNEINEVMSLAMENNKCKDRFIYLYDSRKVSWEENLKRMSECDIYIEQLRWGEWGMTALEAAALGKIVITNFKSVSKYEKEYGHSEILVANNKTDLFDLIDWLANWSDDDIERKKKLTREWIELHHSLVAVGNRLKSIIGG